MLNQEIARYFNSGYAVVGIYVLALIEKIGRSLPTRIGGLETRYAGQLTAAVAQAEKAAREALDRTESSYKAAVIADWTITAVELASGIGAIKVAAREVAEKALLKGALPEAAKRAAIKFAAKQVAVAAAVQGAATAVLPPILESTGLNEHQIRAGLVLIQAMGALRMAAHAGSAKPRAGEKSAGNNREVSTPDGALEPELSPGARKRQRGDLFNRARASKYEYNELYIENPSGGGYVKLDSYNHRSGEIVSRKWTQLAEIGETSAVAYIRELARKYPPGAQIADVPTNKDLRGKILEGQMFLEVPVQTKHIPKTILDTATSLDVFIRDISGHIYNPAG